jgi:hypothetical protein
MSKGGDLNWGVIPCEEKPKDKRLDKIEAKFLPKLPATFYVLGSCGSGKSSILWTLLTEGYMYKKGKGKLTSVFDEALIYLGTLDAKEAFEKLPIDNTLILEEFEPATFDEYQNDLKAHQMEKLAKKKPLLNILLIFDDFVGVNLMKKPRPNVAPPIEKLALTSRHESNTSIFFCSQVYKNTGFSKPSIRNNITTFIISQMSRGELGKIAEELADEYEPDEWLYHYDCIMAKQPYNFVSYDRRRKKGEKWMERFAYPFPPPQRMNSIKDKMKRSGKIADSDSESSSSDSE